MNRTIPLSRPDITEKEINYVLEVLRTPHLSLGPKLVVNSDVLEYVIIGGNPAHIIRLSKELV